MLEGAHDAATPEGEEAAVSATAPLNPPVDVREIVEVTVSPATNETLSGFAETEKSVIALTEAAKTSSRPSDLGALEISITPPSFDVPDKAMLEAYAAAGVDRLILRPRPEMDAAALERFAADAGRALKLKA